MSKEEKPTESARNREKKKYSQNSPATTKGRESPQRGINRKREKELKARFLAVTGHAGR